MWEAPNSAAQYATGCTPIQLSAITAIITPYEVSFLVVGIDGLFVINRIVDIIFLKDMILQFWLMYFKVSSRRGRVLVRYRKAIFQ